MGAKRGAQSMEYRTLGKTGLRVSALGLGGASLGGVYGPVDEAAAIRAPIRNKFWAVGRPENS